MVTAWFKMTGGQVWCQHAAGGQQHAAGGQQHAAGGPQHAVGGAQHAAGGPQHGVGGPQHAFSVVLAWFKMAGGQVWRQHAGGGQQHLHLVAHPVVNSAEHSANRPA